MKKTRTYDPEKMNKLVQFIREKSAEYQSKKSLVNNN